MTNKEVLGIDLGGVIIDKDRNDDTDTSFLGKNFLRTTAVPGAIEVITRLVERRFGDRVYIVSKCGPAVQEKSGLWLAHQDVFGRTGINPEHVRFCRKRDEKAPICAELGITHFIDDRLEVLSHLTTVANRYLFRHSPREAEKFCEHLSKVTCVNEWAELERLLIS